MYTKSVSDMMHWTQEIPIGAGNVFADDSAAAIAEFIRTKGITRCPTACVLPTQGLVGAADRAALEEYSVARDRTRREKMAARMRSFLEAGLPLAEENSPSAAEGSGSRALPTPRA
jgi:hypothetical protein